MRSVKYLVVAGAFSLLAPAANAADLAIMPPPAPPAVEFGGWYLRGDIGMTNQGLRDIHNVQMDSATAFTWLDKGRFDAGPLFGLGVGYQFNSWLRGDLTGEYRGRVSFDALDQFDNGGTINTNHYTAKKSEWLFLANGYIDLGTWSGVTPFVGAGIGTARVQIDSYRDDNIIAGGGGWAPSASRWNFAWAIHAGLGYQVSRNLTLEFAYRYVDLGKGMTGDTINYDGTNPIVGNSTYFNHITSHDLKFGVRWLLDSEPDYAPPPLVRKG